MEWFSTNLTLAIHNPAFSIQARIRCEAQLCEWFHFAGPFEAVETERNTKKLLFFLVRVYTFWRNADFVADDDVRIYSNKVLTFRKFV